MKRAPTDEENETNKKARVSLPAEPSSSSIDNSECSRCIKENTFTSSECIKLDLAPSVYFRLASIIADVTIADTFLDNPDPTVQLLSIYAHKLAKDSELALNAILMLYPLIQNHLQEGVRKLTAPMKMTKLHHARELQFIQSCIQDVKEPTLGMVRSQSESAVKELVDLGQIMLSNVRYARLFPLLCILIDASPSTTSNSRYTFDQQASQISNASFRASQENITDLYGDDPVNDNMTQSSFAFVLDPEFPSSQYQSSTGAEQDISYTSNDFASRHSSQSVDINTSYIPSPASKHSPSIVFFNTDSQPVDVASPDSTFAETPLLNVPDYEDLSTSEIKAKIKGYGMKASNNRAQMIAELQEIFVRIADQNSSQRASQQTTPTQESFEILSSSSQGGGLDPNKRSDIIEHLKSTPEIWEKIITYNTVSIDECLAGINCKRGEMKMVLDEAAAAEGVFKRKESEK